MLLREVFGLFRLRRITRLRKDADRAKLSDDKTLATSVVKRLKALMRDREELAWGHKRLAEHERDVLERDRAAAARRPRAGDAARPGRAPRRRPFRQAHRHRHGHEPVGAC